MIKCRICKRNFLVISSTHLKKEHGISLTNYRQLYHHSKIGFSVTIDKLPKTDPRYQQWLLSLKNRPKPWNTGKTKETNLSVKKISKTFKKKHLDNFLAWRNKMKELGLIRSVYPPFEKTVDLAFLIGLSLGDGNIQKFPRTERLLIALNSNNDKLIKYTAKIMSNVFDKKAISKKTKGVNCVRVWVYQKNISKRLNIPSGNRSKSKKGIPNWIWRSKKYIIGCLKGLFEAEGSLSIHLPTCTYNFQFSNKNKKLLDDVGKALEFLKFHPEYRKCATRLRKREEVGRFKNLISFREYNL